MSLNQAEIYLDQAASTAVDSRVLAAMEPFLARTAANPSSMHDAGLDARKAVREARALAANLLGAHEDEIVFTSGGTESNNLAILGAARANRAFGNGIITSAIEHHSVLRAAAQLETEGFVRTDVGVDAVGRVNPDDVARAISSETLLVSILFANNEIGTVQPIAEIAKIVKQKRKEFGRVFPLLHVDACQASGPHELNAARLGADLLTLNGAKVYGPKGVGVLYVRRGINLQPLMFGGRQEFGLRPGTENVAGIVGLAAALRLAAEGRAAEVARLENLRDKLEAGLERLGATVNSRSPERLPGLVHASFPGLDGEALLIYLSANGIHCSTGAACEASEGEASHVLAAIGLSPDLAKGSLRFSLGRSTTETDIDAVLAALPGIMEKILLARVDARVRA